MVVVMICSKTSEETHQYTAYSGRDHHCSCVGYTSCVHMAVLSAQKEIFEVSGLNSRT
jgi:hypothetical protein